MKVRFRKDTIRAVALTACILLALLSGFMLMRGWERQEKARLEAVPRESRPQRRVQVDGQWYIRNFDLETVLVMGLDKYQQETDLVGYINEQQADFQMLILLDHTEKTCRMLQLNRDTMTRIRRLGVTGGEAGSFQGQLALAHAYGSGGSDSCLNATRAVSELLLNVPVQHYLALTMDAVEVINDAVGGVPVEIRDDFSHVDPALRKGETVRLQGSQALTYVRARSGMDDPTNLNRMERQRQYMAALQKEVERMEQQDPAFFARTLLDISEYFQSDYSVNQLEQLIDRISTYEVEPVRTLKGKSVESGEFVEFHVDQKALEQTVLELFYEKE